MGGAGKLSLDVRKGLHVGIHVAVSSVRGWGMCVFRYSGGGTRSSEEVAYSKCEREWFGCVVRVIDVC